MTRSRLAVYLAVALIPMLLGSGLAVVDVWRQYAARPDLGGVHAAVGLGVQTEQVTQTGRGRR